MHGSAATMLEGRPVLADQLSACFLTAWTLLSMAAHVLSWAPDAAAALPLLALVEVPPGEPSADACAEVRPRTSQLVRLLAIIDSPLQHALSCQESQLHGTFWEKW